MRLITALAMLAAPACAGARAQTAADTAAIDSALLTVVVRDLRSGRKVWVTVSNLQPRVAEAVIRWTRCTTRASFLNYWRYESRVDVRKGINSWIVDRPHMMSVADGSC